MTLASKDDKQFGMRLMFEDPHDRELVNEDELLRELNYDGVFRKNPYYGMDKVKTPDAFFFRFYLSR